MDVFQSVDTPIPEPAGDRPEPQPLRLLGQLRQIVGHDLSNQLVAVQGLLQVLQLEVGERFGAEAQDYLRRAVAATRRAQDIVQAVKALTRLGCEKAPREAVSLEELLPEIAAEVKRLHPAAALEWRLDPDAVRLSAPRALFQQGLVRLVRLLLSADAAGRLGIHSRRTPSAVELTLASTAPTPAANNLDWILAQELLAACGTRPGVLSRASGQGNFFTLSVPAG